MCLQTPVVWQAVEPADVEALSGCATLELLTWADAPSEALRHNAHTNQCPWLDETGTEKQVLGCSLSPDCLIEFMQAPM